MKKKRKSLIGYTFNNWAKVMTKSHPNWKGRVFTAGIFDKSSDLTTTKVRITIEEI
jgi:hypothetical protein